MRKVKRGDLVQNCHGEVLKVNKLSADNSRFMSMVSPIWHCLENWVHAPDHLRLRACMDIPADPGEPQAPEFRWLAMDWGEVWLFSHRPSVRGIKSGGWDVIDSSLCEKVVDEPPSWIKPGELWERDRFAGHGKSVYHGAKLWGDYWWRKVGDHGEELPDSAVAQRGVILDKAKSVINGERQDQYGSPEDSFALIAEYWDTYLTSTVKGKVRTLDAKDVAVMMVLFKLARQANQHKEDNLIDAAGYLGILGDMEES